MTDNPSGKQMPADAAIDTIWKLAKSIDFCMFVTWDGERQRARPLSARPDREAGRIYFLTDLSGAKDEQIARFPKVTLAFADVRNHDYVAITGKAEVSDDRARIRDLWTAADKAWWDTADDPSIRLIVFEPEDAEIWKGPNRLIAGAKLLAAAFTGAKPAFGENTKVGHL
jgi:general stress protein 26